MPRSELLRANRANRLAAAPPDATAAPRHCAALASFLLCGLSLPTFAVDTKPNVPASDYGRFERIASPRISPDGSAIAYVIQRVDDQRTLHVRQPGSQRNWSVPWGTTPVFSATGAYISWRVTPSKEERKELEEAKKPVRDRGELLVLASGERRDLGEVADLSFDPTGVYLAVAGPARVAEESGGDRNVSDLHVHHLAQGTTTVFGNVEEFSWHEELPVLAMVTSSAGGRGNGVQIYAPAKGALIGLDHSSSKYRHLVWHERYADLAVLRERAEPSSEANEGAKNDAGARGADADGGTSGEGSEPSQSESTDTSGTGDPGGEDSWADDTSHELVLWRDVLGAQAVSIVLTPGSQGLDPDLYIAGDAAPSWSPDGSRISFGVRESVAASETQSRTQRNGEGDTPESAAPAVATRKEDLPGVQIWHAGDVETIPMQKAREQRYRDRSLLTVWDIDAQSVVRVGVELDNTARTLNDFAHAIVDDEAPYPWGNMFGRPYRDVWTVDLESGERTKSLERVRYAWPSTEGRYLLWFDGEHYSTLDLTTGARVNLTEDLNTTFADLEDDHPNDGLQPPIGVGGWLENDTAVLLYDRFDVWRLAPDGSSATCLTNGNDREIEHRLIDLDDREEAYSEQEGLLFSLRDEWTEERGLARWDGAYRRLALSEHSYRNVAKATHADAYLYRRESRVEPPALWLTDGTFDQPTEVAGSNPFFGDYAWTKAELVEYENAQGQRLHGTLLYPANHDPSRRYPMIVYAYELLAPWIRFWQPPDETDYYNFTAWTQNDYFVLMPDIVFRAGDPGVSLAETLDRALAAVDAKGLIDRSRVGFAGHSWGGYEAAYLAARTDLFATTVSGAPLTDFVSFMGQFHWGPGYAETGHWETGQARMAVPYWDDPEGHERNSPLHGVGEMTTPILMAHGNQDSVVEFFQSTIFYNFARRAGKQMVLLVYEGEDHGLRVEENQIDYHRRILEWFDHFLKGEPAATWITEGTSWEHHEREKRRVAGKD